MNEDLKKQLFDFLESSRRKHYECPDPFYSCALSEDGNEYHTSTECDCGADDYNKRLDEMIGKLKNDNHGYLEIRIAHKETIYKGIDYLPDNVKRGSVIACAHFGELSVISIFSDNNERKILVRTK
jgi:hypothetical protein